MPDQTLIHENLTKADADDREAKHTAMGASSVKKEGPDARGRYKLTIVYAG